MDSFALQTTSFRGIGRITTRELRDTLGAAVSRIRNFRVRDYDVIRASFAGQIADALQLGTVEDLFYGIDAVPLTGQKADLNALRESVPASRVEPGLALHRQVSRRSGGKRRTTFRVIVQAESAPWRTYRRRAMQAAVEEGVAREYGRWKIVPDRSDLEFWVQQAGKQALIGLRLTDRTMRHRTYKTANLPGSLRPTIARALVLLSNPEADDVFLDPMCGAGTLLIERALAGRYRLLLGGDIREEAVRSTLENFGNRHKPREVRRWDATRLPLDARSVDRVATNLPWGRQIGSPAGNRTLYAGALEEIDRVLKTNGRAVFLTSEWDLFRAASEAVPDLVLVDHVRDIAVLGRRADIFVLEKLEGNA